MVSEEIADLIYGAGVLMRGSEMDEFQAVEYLRSHFPLSEYCLVRDWIWVDVNVNADQLSRIERNSCRPVVLYAHTVLYDSSRRYDVGDFVRSSLLHRHHEMGLFQTINTIYVMLGDGVRKRSDLGVVGKIY